VLRKKAAGVKISNFNFFLFFPDQEQSQMLKDRGDVSCPPARSLPLHRPISDSPRIMVLTAWFFFFPSATSGHVDWQQGAGIPSRMDEIMLTLLPRFSWVYENELGLFISPPFFPPPTGGGLVTAKDQERWSVFPLLKQAAFLPLRNMLTWSNSVSQPAVRLRLFFSFFQAGAVAKHCR